MQITAGLAGEVLPVSPEMDLAAGIQAGMESLAGAVQAAANARDAKGAGVGRVCRCHVVVVQGCDAGRAYSIQDVEEAAAKALGAWAGTKPGECSVDYL